jgi:hypothetical protein
MIGCDLIRDLKLFNIEELNIFNDTQKFNHKYYKGRFK